MSLPEVKTVIIVLEIQIKILPVNRWGITRPLSSLQGKGRCMKLFHLLYSSRGFDCEIVLFIPVLADVVKLRTRRVYHDQFPVVVPHSTGKRENAMRFLLALGASKNGYETLSCQRDDVPPLKL